MEVIWYRLVLVALIVGSVAFPAIQPVAAIFAVYTMLMEWLNSQNSRNIPTVDYSEQLNRLEDQVNVNAVNIDSAADAELSYLERLETVEEKVDEYLTKEHLKDLYQ